MSGFLLLTVIFLAGGCKDDLFYDPEIGEGEGTLTAQVVFSPVLDALDNTRTAGDAIKQIKSLCVFIYDRNNRLVRRVPQSELLGLTFSDNDKMPADAYENAPDGSHQAEAKTPKATFSIEGVEFGRYYIYAVANMGDLTQYSDDDLDTPDKLKNIELIWNESDISANDQMFGYFTPSDAKSSQGFDAPLVTVNNTNVSLHAWLKRAASKVTVAVDGSQLYEGVSVEIRSIQIRDIPQSCFLGRDNVASSHLIADGEKTELQGANNIVNKSQTWPRNIDDAHTETANAYFFYENMQGEGQSKHQAWSQPATTPEFPDGNDPQSKGFKDSKVHGSYIEVVGYYRSTVPGHVSEGPIVYRFMLGKDVDNNYDAQRNYHYKLTLKLRNYANENDWHIVYPQTPDIIARDPYYISYLYDQTMLYPVKIVGGKLISLRADLPVDDTNKNSWHPAQVDPRETIQPYYTGAIDNPGPWNGFLSVRKTTKASFGTVAEGFGSLNPNTYTENYNYYNTNKRGWRTYDDLTPGKHPHADGDYIIENSGSEWVAKVPLYTRAKVMVSQTAYTGNNPYVAYQRWAHVTFTAKVEDVNGDLHTVSKTVTIIQMRRVVNPKGIWRSGNNVQPFHVEMMILPYESSFTFEPLYSDGPWYAEIEQGDWFTLEPTPGRSQRNADGTISGIGDPYKQTDLGEPDDKTNPGRIIDFTFRPNGTTSTPRGGIIRIYYNNYTCVHRIFVRQGYDPVSFYGSATKWHSFNLKTADEEVDDPTLEGSYFRRYNTGLPIAASNNKFDKFFVNGTDEDFQIAGTNDTRKWNQITTTQAAWPTFTIDGKVCQIPDVNDWNNLINNDNTLYGFGVLYGDGDEETLISRTDLYGQTNDKGRGMRGVFLCDAKTGTQIFMPIGASGYGRFKQRCEKQNAYNRLPVGWEGVIQYANRYEAMPLTGSSVSGKWEGVDHTFGVNYKPLFWDLWRRQGALYWISENNNANITDHGLDINYYTFDFSVASVADVGLVWPGGWGGEPDPSGTDAIQIRLVEKPQKSNAPKRKAVIKRKTKRKAIR